MLRFAKNFDWKNGRMAKINGGDYPNNSAVKSARKEIEKKYLVKVNGHNLLDGCPFDIEFCNLFKENYLKSIPETEIKIVEI